MEKVLCGSGRQDCQIASLYVSFVYSNNQVSVATVVSRGTTEPKAMITHNKKRKSVDFFFTNRFFRFRTTAAVVQFVFVLTYPLSLPPASIETTALSCIKPLILACVAGTGAITKPALAAFYRSVIGLSGPRVDEIIDTAYDRMTSVSTSLM